MNYYRRYIGDYQRDTMHLSLLEHGAYTMLLDSFYAQDGNLPETHSVLFRLCRAITEEEKQAVTKVADEFFPTIDGKRSNSRGERELSVALPRITTARENGAKGGRPRKENPNETDNKTHPVSETGTYKEPDRKAIPTTNHQPPTTNLQPPASTPQPPAEEKSKTGRADKRGTRIPEGWTPDLDLMAWTLKEQASWTKPHAQRVLMEFRDYWTAKPGQGGVKADWPATWRNWVRREKPFVAGINGHPAPAFGGKQSALEARNAGVVEDYFREAPVAGQTFEHGEEPQ